jgi:hypothetical protein
LFVSDTNKYINNYKNFVFPVTPKLNIMKTLKFVQNSIQNFHQLMNAFQMEAIETQMMISTYSQLIRSKWFNEKKCNFPNDLQMEQAKNQLLDLPKFLPFVGIFFLPLPGVIELYLISVIALERHLNGKVSLLPSQFRKMFNQNEELTSQEL